MELEQALAVRPEVSQFEGWTKGGKRHLADEIGAAWIIYTTVLAGWLFVAGTGVSSLSEHGWPTWGKILFVVVLGLAYVVVLMWALLGLGGSGGHDSWGERRKRDPNEGGRPAADRPS